MKFFQNSRFQKKIFPKAILSLKFKFQAQDSFLDFFLRFGDLKNKSHFLKKSHLFKGGFLKELTVLIYILCISSTSILYTILPSQIGRCLLTLHTSVWKIERCISIVPFDIFYKRSRDRNKQFDKSCINIPMIILVHWMWNYYIMHSI